MRRGTCTGRRPYCGPRLPCCATSRDAIFRTNRLEHGRERTGAGAPAAARGRTADCRPDGLESHALRLCVSGSDLLEALTDPRALDYDPQPRGLLAAREAVCAYYADHGVALDPDQIVLTTSTSEAYSFLFRLLCDPGSEILVPQPGYPLFDFLAALDDVRIKAAPLVYDQGWQIDFGGLSAGDYCRRRGPSCWCIRTTRPGTLPSRGRRRSWRGCAGISIFR